MAELLRRRQQAQQDLDAARNAGDQEAFLDYFKRLATLDDHIEFCPHLAGRWVDEVLEGAVDPDEICDRLRATFDLMAEHRLDAIARGDHLAAERADDALEALRRRLAALLH
ncbi:2-methylisocitrate lyase-like PEP mutase family enzyme [Pararhizobium capsulatum DSM 1112]|uniref:2-methylisocitrate lyase-like PEP mutase family enzyme n=1 Tax=Pararhizobium capsulatum DSM 1112 TaxID=1121113 RepID=A0ABU0BZD3_9HYPH|nr:hypothetical protein [Pararhizobium capsulatum]MDQ0323626.1 2-methylisocitrate lyase-like PEP mutase family enzyme [Pararhizobium capsulatum DSM 1112]